MKIFRFILSLIMGVAVGVGGTDLEKSIVIGGSEYRSAFYPVWLWVNEISTVGEGIQIGEAMFFPVASDDYVLYQSDFESTKTGGELYCQTEQWDEAYAQYHDADNYSFRIRSHTDEEDKYALIKPKWEVFDVLATEYYNIDSLHWVQQYIGKTGTLELSSEANVMGRNFYIQAVSIDDRFESMNIHLFLYEGKLYYWLGMNAHHGSYETYYYIPDNETAASYFIDLIKGILSH